MNKKNSLKKITLIIFAIVFVLTIYAKFISRSAYIPTPKALNEKFNEGLLVINTPQKLDSLVSLEFEGNGHDTAKTLLFMDDFFRNRFYHSYSEFSFHDNWIAVICGHLIWSHFLLPVVPDDIIKFPMAGCSQQGILFQQQLSRLKIPCSSLQFYPMEYQSSGHYAITAYYKSSWHYFDPNLEPIIVDSTMPSLEDIIQRKLYLQMYTKKVNKDFKEYFINKNYKRVQERSYPKGNMYHFHLITHFLSDWLWLILLSIYFILFFKTKKIAI